MRILVVDDDPLLRDAIATGLGLSWPDCEIVTALDGEDGLATFYVHEPDIVLLDVAMPRKSGLEVLAEIRGTSRVPVILLTASIEGSDELAAMLGADGFLAKPFAFPVLLARVRAILADPARESDFLE